MFLRYIYKLTWAKIKTNFNSLHRNNTYSTHIHLYNNDAFIQIEVILSVEVYPITQISLANIGNVRIYEWLLCIYLSSFVYTVIRLEQTYIKVYHAYIIKYAQWNWIEVEEHYLPKMLEIYIYNGPVHSAI